MLLAAVKRYQAASSVMSANSNPIKNRFETPEWFVARPPTDAPIWLESTLVRYSNSPDRQTIYPPGLSAVARMSTWISADKAAFLELQQMR
jgi:hypothetical protein